MVELQIQSVESPLLESPGAVSLALELVARAQTMGFLPDRAGGRIEPNRAYLEELAELLRQQGIAVIPTARLIRAIRTQPISDVDLVEALRATLDAVDSSPHPDGEWEPARKALGDELLARLVRASMSSLRRYAGGERRTPDEVAGRLHLVARLLASLVGSYNEYGARRWFERPRSALDGAAPADVLEQADSEDDERLQRVLELAGHLSGPMSAT